MNNFLKLFAIVGCLGFAGLSYAYEENNSTLNIVNNASGINVEIGIDLICGKSNGYFSKSNARRETKHLDENPIGNTPVTVSWRTCSPMKLGSLSPVNISTTDHSKIHIKFIDIKNKGIDGREYGKVL